MIWEMTIETDEILKMHKTTENTEQIYLKI